MVGQSWVFWKYGVFSEVSSNLVRYMSQRAEILAKCNSSLMYLIFMTAFWVGQGRTHFGNSFEFHGKYRFLCKILEVESCNFDSMIFLSRNKSTFIEILRSFQGGHCFWN